MSEQQDLLPDALPPVRWVTLDDVPVPVTPHYAGLVFSTRPRIAGASDGFDYFIKGPEIEVVVAEAVGYELAARAGLDVPEWALCRASHDEDVFFASRAMRVRSGVDQLIARKLHVNGDFLG
ncbi:MAG: hypothetical protein JWN79_2435, partial [Gemmatimonadetes bacterium]|nr:hypothetical protein [Gemmatimonadota bacterium]